MMKKRHVHDLSNYSWSSCKAGEITPIKVTEVLGGDTIEVRSEAVLRLDALARPTMHPLKQKVFHFYCPNRLVWDNWNDFITQGADGASTAVHPYVDLTDATGPGSSLWERMIGARVLTGKGERVNPIPMAMYWLIMQKYFTDHQIDQAIASTFPVSLTDGDNTAAFTGFVLPYSAAWKKDYFTTARPDPQLGTAVPIPQSGIVSNGVAPTMTGGTVSNQVLQVAGTLANDPVTLAGGSTTDGPLVFGNESGLEMDESAVMRDLSIAGALQLFREKRAEWGSRIIDYLRQGFGSKISSYELQEPILLNWGQKTIRFSEVLQTAEGSDPVGTLRGHGIGGLGTNKVRYRVPENGFLISLALAMPEPAYLSSAERHWFKNTFTDYFQPEFEGIGQQAIYESEIGFGHAAAGTTQRDPWGYNDPYDEYRRSLNTISGTFATTDKNWHMARDFAGVTPGLNGAFLHGAPTQRIFDDTSGEVYKLFAYNHIVARRIVKRRVHKRIL